MTKLAVLEEIRQSAKKRILYLPHAIRQMSRPERMISPLDVRDVIEHGEIIEDYPEDPRGHSCLVFHQKNKGFPIHVVAPPKRIIWL